MGFTTLDDLADRARCRLDPVAGVSRLPVRTDHPAGGIARPVRPAAVLVGLIPRPGGATVLLTRRSPAMATHPGDIAFPGGKTDRQDKDAVATALREAHEEVGIMPGHVRLLARGAPALTATGFRIVPVIGLLPAGFQARIDPVEVAAIFEVPLDFLFDPANYRQAQAWWKGRRRDYVEINWQDCRIWGITAGIIHDLQARLYGR